MSTIKRFFAAMRVMPWLVAVAFSSPAQASGLGAKALEGTWNVVVNIRECGDGATIRSFPRLITFAKGGTLTEAAAGGTEAAPAYRGVGLGAWEHLGNGEFTYSLKFLRLTAFGGPDGFISETRILEVGDNGSSYLADGVAFITLANGVEIGPLCALEQGSKLY